jgi:hypothetical protein
MGQMHVSQPLHGTGASIHADGVTGTKDDGKKMSPLGVACTNWNG